MAIKVDIVKAFDSVEWSLLSNILTNLVFCNKFSNWTLQCITTTSLSFLVNGSPFGFLKPERGIRQGDPLSPFLFVIYTEILSRMLVDQEQRGHFKGVKISRSSPPISHLLYANDLIIFCRTTEMDALCIMNTLDKFSSWTSQLPNSSKSSVYFSSNTTPHDKATILRILNFKECSHKEKHIGFSFCKTPSKKDAFNDLIARIISKLSG